MGRQVTQVDTLWCWGKVRGNLYCKISKFSFIVMMITNELSIGLLIYRTSVQWPWGIIWNSSSTECAPPWTWVVFEGQLGSKKTLLHHRDNFSQWRSRYNTVGQHTALNSRKGTSLWTWRLKRHKIRVWQDMRRNDSPMRLPFQPKWE